MSNFKIEYAICGSLSSSPGESGIIASSKGIVEELGLFDRVVECDRFFSAAQRSYEHNYLDNEKITQYYFLNNTKQLTEKYPKLLLRGRIRFTRFVDANRVYNRREIYFIPNSDPTKLLAVQNGLALLTEFHKLQHGKLEAATIRVENSHTQSDPKFIYCILECLNTKTVLKLHSAKLNDEQIITHVYTALNAFPEIYSKHFQFGFNLVESDEISQKQLHIFSCIDAGKTLREISETRFSDPILEYITNAFLNKSSIDMDESFLGTDIDFTNPANLYSLFELHYLLTVCKLVVMDDMPGSFQVSQYVNAIKDFITKNFEIAKQTQNVVLAYTTLIKLNSVDEFLFNKFWNFILISEVNTSSYLSNVILKENIEEFAKSRLLSKTSFALILVELNSLFSGIKSNKIESLKIQLLISTLNSKNELPVNELQDLIYYYFENNSLLKEHLKLGELLKKFRIARNSSKLTEQDIKLLFSNLIYAELSSDDLTAVINRIGYSSILTYVSVKDLRNQSSNQLSELLWKILENNIISEKSSLERNINLSMQIFDVEKNEFLAKKVFRYVTNLVHSNSSENELLNLIEVIIKYKDNFFANFSLQGLIQEAFSEKIDFPSNSLFVEKIVAIAKEYKISIDIDGIAVKDSTRMEYTISFFANNLDVFKESQVKKILESVLNFEQYQKPYNSLSDYVTVCSSYLKYFPNESEHTYDLIIFYLNKYLPEVSYSMMVVTFRALIEQIKNDSLFWQSLFDSESFLIVQKKFLKEEFNVSTFEDLNQLRSFANRNGFSKNSKLIDLLNEIDKLLYDRYIFNKGLIPFNIMNTTKLINRRLLIVTLVLALSTICFAFATIYFSAQLRRPNLQVQQLNDRIDQQSIRLKQLQDSIKVRPEVITTPPLCPAPNGEFSSAAVTYISTKGLRSKSVEAIVNIVFTSYSIVKQKYAGQEEAFAKELMKENPECFNLSKICGCDTLLHIPIYRSN